MQRLELGEASPSRYVLAGQGVHVVEALAALDTEPAGQAVQSEVPSPEE